MAQQINQNLRKLSFTLMFVSTIICGLLIIPLIWMLPMYFAHKRALNDSNSHVVLGILEILFAGFIPGAFAGLCLLLSGGK
jgi:hypothetical protein